MTDKVMLSSDQKGQVIGACVAYLCENEHVSEGAEPKRWYAQDELVYFEF